MCIDIDGIRDNCTSTGMKFVFYTIISTFTRMKSLILKGFLLLSISGFSQQFKTVEIGIDGLTCSMCSRATEMNIRKLPFVDSVAMDLTNTNGVVTFKKDTQVDLDRIAEAVR